MESLLYGLSRLAADLEQFFCAVLFIQDIISDVLEFVAVRAIIGEELEHMQRYSRRHCFSMPKSQVAESVILANPQGYARPSGFSSTMGRLAPISARTSFPL